MSESTITGLSIHTAVTRQSTHLLCGPDNVPASRDDFEVVGAFNPGAVRVGDEVVLLVRVAERPRETRPGFTGLPRWDAEAGMTVDWVPDEELNVVDPRIVEDKTDGRIRLTFISHLRVMRCGDGRQVQEISPVMLGPEGGLDEYGVEDPRITYLDGRYYITYVAVSKHGPATALASTTDFRTFERHGVVFCPENKDVVFFPEKIGGAYAAMHRPVCNAPFTRPEMWLARSHDLLHWGSHVPLEAVGSHWQSGRVGGGVPPIRVPEGYLAIYHGNIRPVLPGDVGAYFGGALLLDAADPSKVLKHVPEPILAPEQGFETKGFVPNVVFPTGVVQDGDTLLVYYGAADAFTAVAELSLREIMDAMVEV